MDESISTSEANSCAAGKTNNSNSRKFHPSPSLIPAPKHRSVWENMIPHFIQRWNSVSEQFVLCSSVSALCGVQLAANFWGSNAISTWSISGKYQSVYENSGSQNRKALLSMLWPLLYTSPEALHIRWNIIFHKQLVLSELNITCWLHITKALWVVSGKKKSYCTNSWSLLKIMCLCLCIAFNIQLTQASLLKILHTQLTIWKLHTYLLSYFTASGLW